MYLKSLDHVNQYQLNINRVFNYIFNLHCFSLPENGSKRKWLEEVSLPLVELGLELNPVKTETMQEGRQTLHDAEDADG